MKFTQKIMKYLKISLNYALLVRFFSRGGTGEYKKVHLKGNTEVQ